MLTFEMMGLSTRPRLVDIEVATHCQAEMASRAEKTRRKLGGERFPGWPTSGHLQRNAFGAPGSGEDGEGSPLWEVSQAEKTVDAFRILVLGDLLIHESAGKGIIAAILHTDMVKHNEMIKAREFTLTTSEMLN